MTTKSDFSEDEWDRIVRAPFVAGLAISLADPGGPIEVTKESMASIKAATHPSSQEQLIIEAATEIQADVQAKTNPLKGYRPTSEGTAPAGGLVELGAAIVAAKATPEETAAFGQWLVDTAQAVADAAKDGGFLGFHAKQVSKGEHEMLDRVRAASHPPDAGWRPRSSGRYRPARVLPRPRPLAALLSASVGPTPPRPRPCSTG